MAVIASTGFAMLVASHNPHLSYAGLFLAAAGLYSAIPNGIAWISNNVEGVYKRGVVIGTFVAWGNLNGIVSSNIYLQKDAPWYRLANSIVLGYLLVALLGGSILNLTFLWIGNKKRDREIVWRREKLLNMSDEEQLDLADFHPDFRYTL